MAAKIGREDDDDTYHHIDAVLAKYNHMLTTATNSSGKRYQYHGNSNSTPFAINTPASDNRMNKNHDTNYSSNMYSYQSTPTSVHRKSLAVANNGLYHDSHDSHTPVSYNNSNGNTAVSDDPYTTAVRTMSNQYEKRMKVLNVDALKQFYDHICLHDQILNEMRSDPTSIEFLPKHINELIESFINNNREQYIKSLIEKLSMRDGNISSLKSDVYTLINEIHGMKDNINDCNLLGQTIKSLQEQMSVLTNQSTAYVADIDNYKQSIALLEVNNNKSMDIINSANESINQKQALITQLHDDINQLTSNNTILNNRITSMDDIANSMKETIAAVKASEAKVVDELSVVKSNLSSSIDKYNLLHSQHEHVNNQLTEAKNEVTKLKEEVVTRVAQEDMTNNKLNDILHQVETNIAIEEKDRLVLIAKMKDERQTVYEKLSLEIMKERKNSQYLKDDMNALQSKYASLTHEYQLLSQSESKLKDTIQVEVVAKESLKATVSDLKDDLLQCKKSIHDYESHIANERARYDVIMKENNVLTETIASNKRMYHTSVDDMKAIIDTCKSKESKYEYDMKCEAEVAIELKNKVQMYSNKLNEASSSIEILKNMIKGKASDAEMIQVDMTNKINHYIDTLNQSKVEYNEMVKKCQAEVEHKQREVDSKQREIDMKQREIDGIISTHRRELDNKQREMDSHSVSHCKVIENIKNTHKQEIERMHKEMEHNTRLCREDIENNASMCKQQVDSIQKAMDQSLRLYKDEIDSNTVVHKQEVERMQKEMEYKSKLYREEIRTKQCELDDTVSMYKRTFDTKQHECDHMLAKHQSELDTNLIQYRNELEATTATHTRALQALQKEYDAAIARHEHEMHEFQIMRQQDRQKDADLQNERILQDNAKHNERVKELCIAHEEEVTQLKKTLTHKNEDIDRYQGLLRSAQDTASQKDASWMSKTDELMSEKLTIMRDYDAALRKLQQLDVLTVEHDELQIEYNRLNDRCKLVEKELTTSNELHLLSIDQVKQLKIDIHNQTNAHDMFIDNNNKMIKKIFSLVKNEIADVKASVEVLRKNHRKEMTLISRNMVSNVKVYLEKLIYLNKRELLDLRIVMDNAHETEMSIAQKSFNDTVNHLINNNNASSK